MTGIDFKPLKGILRDKGSKKREAINSELVMNAFEIATSNFQEMAEGMKEEELAMLIMSLENWSNRRCYTKTKHNFKIGDIFYADLGNTFKPEYAYPHPVLILERIGFYLLVVPSSTSDDNINQAYHPIDNPKGNKYMRKVYGANHKLNDGFEKTSALLLSNVRTISQGRLIAPKGRITNVSLLDEIKQTVFEYLFPRQNIKMKKLEHRIAELEETIEKLK